MHQTEQSSLCSQNGKAINCDIIRRSASGIFFKIVKLQVENSGLGTRQWDSIRPRSKILHCFLIKQINGTMLCHY